MTYEKQFDNDRDNQISMGGQATTEAVDKGGVFVPLSNKNIDAMKNIQFYSEIFKGDIK